MNGFSSAELARLMERLNDAPLNGAPGALVIGELSARAEERALQDEANPIAEDRRPEHHQRRARDRERVRLVDERRE